MMLGFFIADMAENAALKGIDATFYSVVSQSRLIITAFIAWVWFGKKLGNLRWITIFILFGTMLAWSQIKEGEETKPPVDGTVIAYVLAFAKIFLACLCGVFGESAFRTNIPFPVQMGNAFLMGTLWGLLVSPFFMLNKIYDFHEKSL